MIRCSFLADSFLISTYRGKHIEVDFIQRIKLVGLDIWNEPGGEISRSLHRLPTESCLVFIVHFYAMALFKNIFIAT